MDILGHITLETTLTEPVSFDIDLERNENAEPSAILKFLKPKIKIMSVLGTKSYAPYGEPDGQYRSVFKLAVMTLGFMTVSLIIYKIVS